MNCTVPSVHKESVLDLSHVAALGFLKIHLSGFLIRVVIVFSPPPSFRQIGVGQLETGVLKDFAKRRKKKKEKSCLFPPLLNSLGIQPEQEPLTVPF